MYFRRAPPATETDKAILAGTKSMEELVKMDDFLQTYMNKSKPILDLFSNKENLEKYIDILLKSEDKSLATITVRAFPESNRSFHNIFRGYRDTFAKCMTVFDIKGPRGKFLTGCILNALSIVMMNDFAGTMEVIYRDQRIINPILEHIDYPLFKSIFLDSTNLCETDLPEFIFWHVFKAVSKYPGTIPSREMDIEIAYPTYNAKQAAAAWELVAKFFEYRVEAYCDRKFSNAVLRYLSSRTTLSAPELAAAEHLYVDENDQLNRAMTTLVFNTITNHDGSDNSLLVAAFNYFSRQDLLLTDAETERAILLGFDRGFRASSSNRVMISAKNMITNRLVYISHDKKLQVARNCSQHYLSTKSAMNHMGCVFSVAALAEFGVDFDGEIADSIDRWNKDHKI